MGAMIVYFFKPEYRNWLLFLQPSLDIGTLFAIIGHVFLFCVLCISTLHCIMTYGALDVSTYFTELLAETGREWAGKVLRKEDMEVYFFRLLLEWGRLTDDKRDELGFVLEG